MRGMRLSLTEANTHHVQLNFPFAIHGSDGSKHTKLLIGINAEAAAMETAWDINEK